MTRTPDVPKTAGRDANARAAWPQVRLGEIIELKRGYDLPSSTREPGQHPVVSSSGVTGTHASSKVRAPGARAILTSWFVDFDPVRAKAEGRQPIGMDAETAALFPDSFTDSPLGPIPSGWQVQSLDAIATFLNGLALQRYPPTGDRVLPVIKIPELRAGVTSSTGRASTAVPEQYIVRDGDVLFSWSGSLLAVLWSGGVGALNQHLFRVASEAYPRWLYYFWIREHLEAFRQIAAGKATTMGPIQRGHLTQAACLVPSHAIVQMTTDVLEPMLDMILRNGQESRILAATRDGLLPKLVGGEVRVAA